VWSPRGSEPVEESGVDGLGRLRGELLREDRAAESTELVPLSAQVYSANTTEPLTELGIPSQQNAAAFRKGRPG